MRDGKGPPEAGEHMTTPTELRQKADEADARAAASWERSDTDGFLSQWASGLTATQARMEADLIEAGGTSIFDALFDLSGNFVPARTISTRFGTRWMVLDAGGRATGTFLPFHPKRRETLAKRGFVEGLVERPAKVELVGGGYGLSGAANVYAAVVPADKPHEAPKAIVSSDRWAD